VAASECFGQVADDASGARRSHAPLGAVGDLDIEPLDRECEGAVDRGEGSTEQVVRRTGAFDGARVAAAAQSGPVAVQVAGVGGREDRGRRLGSQQVGGHGLALECSDGLAGGERRSSGHGCPVLEGHFTIKTLRKLLHFTSRQEARRRIARFELELLQDCFQAWQSAGFAVGTDAYGLDLGTRQPDESPCDAPCRPPPLASVAIADASSDGQHCTDLVLDMDYPTVLVSRNERDSKFDALDADLNLCLEAAPQERHAPTAHTAADRDAKFDALDADLSNCLDDPAAQQWPKENWAASQQLSGAPSPGIVTRM